MNELFHKYSKKYFTMKNCDFTSELGIGQLHRPQ